MDDMKGDDQVTFDDDLDAMMAEFPAPGDLDTDIAAGDTKMDVDDPSSDSDRSGVDPTAFFIEDDGDASTGDEYDPTDDVVVGRNDRLELPGVDHTDASDRADQSMWNHPAHFDTDVKTMDREEKHSQLTGHDMDVIMTPVPQSMPVVVAPGTGSASSSSSSQGRGAFDLVNVFSNHPGADAENPIIRTRIVVHGMDPNDAKGHISSSAVLSAFNKIWPPTAYVGQERVVIGWAVVTVFNYAHNEAGRKSLVALEEMEVNGIRDTVLASVTALNRLAQIGHSDTNLIVSASKYLYRHSIANFEKRLDIDRMENQTRSNPIIAKAEGLLDQRIVSSGFRPNILRRLIISRNNPSMAASARVSDKSKFDFTRDYTQMNKFHTWNRALFRCPKCHDVAWTFYHPPTMDKKLLFCGFDRCALFGAMTIEADIELRTRHTTQARILIDPLELDTENPIPLPDFMRLYMDALPFSLYGDLIGEGLDPSFGTEPGAIGDEAINESTPFRTISGAVPLHAMPIAYLIPSNFGTVTRIDEKTQLSISRNAVIARNTAREVRHIAQKDPKLSELLASEIGRIEIEESQACEIINAASRGIVRDVLPDLVRWIRAITIREESSIITMVKLKLIMHTVFGQVVSRVTRQQAVFARKRREEAERIGSSLPPGRIGIHMVGNLPPLAQLAVNKQISDSTKDSVRQAIRDILSTMVRGDDVIKQRIWNQVSDGIKHHLANVSDWYTSTNPNAGILGASTPSGADDMSMVVPSRPPSIDLGRIGVAFDAHAELFQSINNGFPFRVATSGITPRQVANGKRISIGNSSLPLFTDEDGMHRVSREYQCVEVSVKQAAIVDRQLAAAKLADSVMGGSAARDRVLREAFSTSDSMHRGSPSISDRLRREDVINIGDDRMDDVKLDDRQLLNEVALRSINDFMPFGEVAESVKHARIIIESGTRFIHQWGNESTYSGYFNTRDFDAFAAREYVRVFATVEERRRAIVASGKALLGMLQSETQPNDVILAHATTLAALLGEFNKMFTRDLLPPYGRDINAALVRFKDDTGSIDTRASAVANVTREMRQSRPLKNPIKKIIRRSWNAGIPDDEKKVARAKKTSKTAMDIRNSAMGRVVRDILKRLTSESPNTINTMDVNPSDVGWKAAKGDPRIIEYEDRFVIACIGWAVTSGGDPGASFKVDESIDILARARGDTLIVDLDDLIKNDGLTRRLCFYMRVDEVLIVRELRLLNQQKKGIDLAAKAGGFGAADRQTEWSRRQRIIQERVRVIIIDLRSRRRLFQKLSKFVDQAESARRRATAMIGTGMEENKDNADFIISSVYPHVSQLIDESKFVGIFKDGGESFVFDSTEVYAATKGFAQRLERAVVSSDGRNVIQRVVSGISTVLWFKKVGGEWGWRTVGTESITQVVRARLRAQQKADSSAIDAVIEDDKEKYDDVVVDTRKFVDQDYEPRDIASALIESTLAVMGMAINEGRVGMHRMVQTISQTLRRKKKARDAGVDVKDDGSAALINSLPSIEELDSIEGNAISGIWLLSHLPVDILPDDMKYVRGRGPAQKRTRLEIATEEDLEKDRPEMAGGTPDPKPKTYEIDVTLLRRLFSDAGIVVSDTGGKYYHRTSKNDIIRAASVASIDRLMRMRLETISTSVNMELQANPKYALVTSLAATLETLQRVRRHHRPDNDMVPLPVVSDEEIKADKLAKGTMKTLARLSQINIEYANGSIKKDLVVLHAITKALSRLIPPRTSNKRKAETGGLFGFGGDDTSTGHDTERGVDWRPFVLDLDVIVERIQFLLQAGVTSWRDMEVPVHRVIDQFARNVSIAAAVIGQGAVIRIDNIILFGLGARVNDAYREDRAHALTAAVARFKSRRSHRKPAKQRVWNGTADNSVDDKPMWA